MHVGSFVAPCDSSCSFGFYVFWAYNNLLLRIIIYVPLCCKRALGVGVSLDRNVGQTDGKIKVFFLCFRVPPQLYTITDPIILRVQNGHCTKKNKMICQSFKCLFSFILEIRECLLNRRIEASNHQSACPDQILPAPNSAHFLFPCALAPWNNRRGITIMIRCKCNYYHYDPLQL